MPNVISRFYTYATAAISKAGRRYNDSLQDATTFVDQILIFTRVLPEVEQKARNLKQNQVRQALELMLELQTGLDDITQTIVAGRGHLAEADETGQRLINRLATGAHLTQPENLEYILKGDSEGLAWYLNVVEQGTLKRALLKVPTEQKAMILEALLKELEGNP